MNYINNKKLFAMNSKLSEKKSCTENSQPLYPNCDISIWLRSCQNELIQPIKGTISGTIPTWLNGSLLRNGPGYFEVGNDNFRHWLDGSALLHRFNIESGHVTYQCRFLQSEVFKKNQKANRIVLNEFGTKVVPDPCHTIFRRIAVLFNPKSEDVSDNSNISLCPIGDELYAFGEYPTIHKINSEDLNTEERINIDDYVSIVHHTAHPHVMEDGSVYNLALSRYPTGPRHTIVKFPPKSNTSENVFQQASIVADIPARWPFHPSYMHSFGITESYYVIIEQPLTLSLGALVAAKLKNDPIMKCFRWNPEEKTKINLIDRKTGKLVHKFYSEAFCYFHIINQYEISDYVVVDVCIYRDASMLENMYIDAMQNMQNNENYANIFRAKPVRFVLPLKPEKYQSNLIQLPNTLAEAYYSPKGKIIVTPEELSQLGCETPKINYEKYLGKKYRFFYATSVDIDSNNFGGVIKVDTYTKKAKTWSLKNCYLSEPLFVPRPESKYEDDGVVLSVMLWGGKDTNRVGLLVLDAENFEEMGRAEFETPVSIPKCLHGWFLPKTN